VYLADWDESDAFCNIPREDTPALLDDIAPRLGSWLQRFYGPLRIRTVTPYGLTEPFPMAHGGGQGDSGGVGAYLAVSIQRTQCHRGVALRSLDPRNPSHLANDPRNAAEPTDTFLFAPYDPARAVLEVAFSDDRRPLSRTASGLEGLLNTMYHACWASGGTVNGAKLRAFLVILRGDRLCYAPGIVRPPPPPPSLPSGTSPPPDWWVRPPLVVGSNAPRVHPFPLRRILSISRPVAVRET
jgi:hypothetical protein